MPCLCLVVGFVILYLIVYPFTINFFLGLVSIVFMSIVISCIFDYFYNRKKV